MEKYSANYSYTNHNFTIQNVKGLRKENSEYYPVFCVLKNILHRGTPTLMSSYLQSQLGEIQKLDEFKDILVLIEKDVPKWENTIKGDDDNYNFPAKDFYEKYIPKYLKEYTFIQQLILPEVPFTDIIGRDNNKFAQQQVDFYLPQAKLVIEIDGQQHKKDDLTRFNDAYRDEFLRSYGIEIVRITTTELYNKDTIFESKIEEIKNRLDQSKVRLSYYKTQYETPVYSKANNQKILTATAIMRFQTLILSLLEKKIIKITDSDWSFNILSREIRNFAELAIEDVFLWLEHLCKLKKLPFKRPVVNILFNKSESKFKYKSDYINIDFSILKRWTDEDVNNPKIIFVRTDYYDKVNYFQMSTSDPIIYNIIEDTDDVNSDIPTLKFLLKNIFSFDEFRPGQLPIIIKSLGCNDTIGLLPTGSGKSICYQLSALLQPCISFIVCPIKSLMYDQKDNLDRALITNTNYISSDQSASEKREIGMDFENGKYHFIWISPERFQMQEFRDYLGKLNKEKTMALAVIDEVHCLSEWGHDFRTSYLNLVRTIRDYCPSTSFLGLTATASSFVLEDLKVEFDIASKNIKTLSSFTRKELNFHVLKDDGINSDDKKINLYNLITEMNNDKRVLELAGDSTKSGLIFTLFKNGQLGCYKLSNDISSKFNTKVQWYSGEVPTVREKVDNGGYNNIPVLDNESFNKYKKETQSEYKNNKFPLLVATKSFGMGIDKKNIRYTVHYGIPGSLEALYQEAGRAGRDQESADCYVLYSRENIDKEMKDKLFDPKTSIEEIRMISKDQGFYGRDVLNNFFLWLSNNQGIDKENRIITKIFNKYGEPNKVKLIKCKELNYSFGEIQKAIYRLSIIGIVKDWTIENWNSGNQILKVIFDDFTEESMANSLQNYINRYDKEFILTKRYKDGSKFAKYSNIYFDDSFSTIEKVSLILVEWTYENIIYNRRQSIKNILELCENFTDGETFKSEIEKYFKMTDKSLILDGIAQNPKDYELWFDMFFDTINGSNNSIKKKRLIDKKEVEDIKSSISRLLESYRYNTGFNYISGICRLILDDYENQDGRNRLELAFQQLMEYDEESKINILNNTLTLRHLFSENNTIELSKLLCEYYPGKSIKIYQELNDSHSLGITLEDSLNKLKSIGGLFS